MHMPGNIASPMSMAQYVQAVCGKFQPLGVYKTEAVQIALMECPAGVAGVIPHFLVWPHAVVVADRRVGD